MRERKSVFNILVVLLMALLVIWLGACSPASEPAMEETAGGEQLLQNSCTKCHNLDRVTSKQWTREEWEATVDRMIQKGAEVADKEALLDYLVENYGS